MYLSTATEEFRRAAEKVCFSLEDLIPVKEKEDCWFLPFQTQSKLRTSELIAFIHLITTTKRNYIIERAKARGQDVEIDGLDFLLNKGSWNLLENEFIAATALPYPQRSQVSSLGTTQGNSPADGLYNDEEATLGPPGINLATNDPNRQDSAESATQQTPIMDKKHRKTNQAKSRIGLSIPKEPQESQYEKQTVEVVREIDGRPSLTAYTLGVGDTLELDGTEGVSAKGDGTFQAVVRYRLKKMSKAVESQGRV